MRDEVFRVRARSRVGTAPARTIDLDGEPWWLLGDVLEVRGYPRQLATSYDLLKHVPAEEVERVWVLRPGDDRPLMVRVVSEEGRSAVHDTLPRRESIPEPEPPAFRPTRRRRTPVRKAAPRRSAPVPGFLRISDDD